MKYYLHSVDTMDDEKVSELFQKFSYEGTGLFHAILEKLARQEKPINTTTLKYQLRVGKKLDNCWNFMETIGLISSNSGETFNKQLLTFSKTYQIKKEKNAKKLFEWRKKQDVKDNVPGFGPVRNPPKVKKRKVKEIKVNDNTPTWAAAFENYNPQLIYPFEYPEFAQSWDLWIAYRKERRQIKYGEIGEQAALKKLSKMSNSNHNEALDIILNTIECNYQAFYARKNINNSFSKENGKLSTADRRSEIARIADERFG